MKSHRLPFALALALALVLLPRGGQLAAQVMSPLDRLLHWLDVVAQHRPGELDAPVVDVAGWPTTNLEATIRDAKRVAELLERARSRRGSPDARIKIYDRTFEVSELEKLTGGGNRMLVRGAVLHADVAMLAVNDFSRRPSQGGEPAFVVEDGRSQGSRSQSAHWALGRALIAAIIPAPASDPLALLWFRAVSASLLRDGSMSVAFPHLAVARGLFPSSWEILLDNAYLHQRFSSPEIQAAVQSMNIRGVKLDVLSPKGELEVTVRFFREALALNPSLVEARVRMGRVIGLLGRHEEAASELRKALDANPTDALLYYAELFLAHEEEALGHTDAARGAFTRAAGLYPRAQSPLLALSQLARQSGNRSAALNDLQQVLALPASEAERPDPWWEYYNMHADDAGDLMRQLYDAVRN